MRVAGRVLKEPEPIEERRGGRHERPEELEGVADPLGRDPRGVKRPGGRGEKLAETREAPEEALPGAPQEGPPGFRARGERPSEGRGEAPSPPGDGLPESSELCGVDAELGEVALEDLSEDVLFLEPLREERASDLLGAEGGEAPAKVACRAPESVAVPRPRKAAKEAGRRLETPQGDPNVVYERCVASLSGAFPDLAEPVLLTRERVLQDGEDRERSTVPQGGPPPSILGSRCEGALQPVSPERPGSSSDGWPTW